MQRKFLPGIRSNWVCLFLCGTVVVSASAVAAENFAPTQNGSPATRQTLPSTLPPGPAADPALKLASRTVALTPTPTPEEEKKSPWWSVFSFSTKKESVSPAPDATVSSPSTGKFKSSKASAKKAPMLGPKKSTDAPDNGQAEAAAYAKERQYSEADYIASAVEPKDTKARDLYNEGLLAESEGRHPDAIRAYNGFIKANEQSTKNGVLAAPYHRLALISWKEGNIADAEIYFRYALNYALGANLLIIGGDYSQLLMAKGDDSKAEVILRNTLTYDPENKQLLLYLGRCVALQKKHQESLRYLIAAVGRAHAYEELAAVYRRQGEFELACVAEEKRNEFLASLRPRPQAPLEHSMRTPQQGSMPLPPAAAPQQMPYPMSERQSHDPYSGWTPVPQPSVVPVGQPASAATPVSKVYHYPSNSPSPVYYQYTGNEYPQPATQQPWTQPSPSSAPPPAGAQVPSWVQ